MIHLTQSQYHIHVQSCTVHIMSITQYGWTPLTTAAYNGKCDVVLDLLDSGADVNAQNNVSHCHLRLEPLDISGYVYSYSRRKETFPFLFHRTISAYQ